MIHFSEVERFYHQYGVPRETIEKDYCLTWLLVGVSDSRIIKDLVFYGGTAIKKMYFPKFRFSEDLDFISEKSVKVKDIFELLASIYEQIREKANINFSTLQDTLSVKDERIQFFIAYDGFPELVGEKRVKIDLLTQAEIMQKPLARKILGEYTDLQNIEKYLPVYCLESMVAGKIGMIMEAIRKEPRDIYDLWFLTTRAKIDCVEVKKLYKNKFGIGVMPQEISTRIRDEIYKSRWGLRLAHQIRDLPDIESIMQEIIDWMKTL